MAAAMLKVGETWPPVPPPHRASFMPSPFWPPGHVARSAAPAAWAARRVRGCRGSGAGGRPPPQRADDPGLLADYREPPVRVGAGDVEELLAADPPAQAGDAAAAQGDKQLEDVEAVALRGGLRRHAGGDPVH